MEYITKKNKVRYYFFFLSVFHVWSNSLLYNQIIENPEG